MSMDITGSLTTSIDLVQIARKNPGECARHETGHERKEG